MNLVCAVATTHNRPDLLPTLIRCFLAQDWPAKRLVIYDDHSQYDAQRGDGWILAVDDARSASLGEKRNRAMATAEDWCQPDVFAHWDDDDWYFPHALTACATACRYNAWSRPGLVWYARDGRLTCHRTYAVADRSDRAYQGGWAYRADLWRAGVLRWPAEPSGIDWRLARGMEALGIESGDPCKQGIPPFYLYDPYERTDRLTRRAQGAADWNTRQQERIERIEGPILAYPAEEPPEAAGLSLDALAGMAERKILPRRWRPAEDWLCRD